MMDVALEVEAVVVSLVNIVAASLENEATDQETEVPVGGYLWKFPSEGSNAESDVATLPPPAPQMREYPRKCDRCRVCWVSDREFEFDHLRRCSAPVDSSLREDKKMQATKLGVSRRVWCEVDNSFSQLQWRCDREFDDGSALNSISLAEIAEVSLVEEPPESFQVVTRDGRTIVFQWRPDTGDEVTPLDLVNMDAREWQEYLDEISKYARGSTFESPGTKAGLPTPSNSPKKSERCYFFDQIDRVFQNFNNESDSPVAERLLESRLSSLLQKSGYGTSLCDDDGNSLLHVVLNLNIGAMTSAAISVLLRMGVDCNLQNQAMESPLLLAAASGDHATMSALLSAASIQVELPCALGVTAFHAAANAGDVQMMQLLCNAGAQPELQDENGWTALHYAAACWSGTEALHFLCELLPDGFIDVQCGEGNTALHVAAGCGYQDNVRALLETAASPHVRNSGGDNAYNLALRNNHIQCAVVINDYQSMVLPTYSETPVSRRKENAVSEATTVVQNEYEYQSDEQTEEWVEGFTDEGYAYYYNTVTGESSWFKPETFNGWQTSGENCSEKWSGDDSIPQPHTVSEGSAVRGTKLANGGHQLPLCLIPMVSQLTSLDDPTAVAKFEAFRRKARSQRRHRQSKHRLQDDAPRPNNHS